MRTIKQRLALLDRFHSQERAIMEAKAHDYSGTEDCNKNIKACEMVGICTAEQGVMIRLFDKFQRMTNLLTREAKVKDESLADTIHDARNYLAILADLLEEKAERHEAG